MRHLGMKKLQNTSLTPRVVHASLLSPLTKTPSVRPSPLPWDEEKLSLISRDKGKALASLHRENASLKSQLRELNAKLDKIIGEIQARKEAKPYRPPKNTVNEELILTQNQLAMYEKEHARLSARMALLSDPAFKIKLMDEVEQQEVKVKQLELAISRRGKTKELRDKVLESVLETGELPEMAKDIEFTITEINVFAAQGRMVEKEVQQIAPHLDKLAMRERELVSEVNKLTAELGEVPDDHAQEELKRRIEAARQDLSTSEKLFKFSTSKLKSRIKHLRLELSEATLATQAMERQVSEKAESMRKVAEEIRSLTPLMGREVRKLRAIRSRSISRVYREEFGGGTFLTQDYL